MSSDNDVEMVMMMMPCVRCESICLFEWKQTWFRGGGLIEKEQGTSVAKWISRERY